MPSRFELMASIRVQWQTQTQKHQNSWLLKPNWYSKKCVLFLPIYPLHLSPDPKGRRQKSERTKNLGEPIQLPGKALAIQIHGGYAWVAENTTVARKIDLQV
jgi:hypothetical protein